MDLKKKIIVSASAFLVLGAIFIQNSNSDLFQGNLNLDKFQNQELNIWKLTHLPSKAPADAVSVELEILDHPRTILNLALEARDSVTLTSLVFEVDNDDDANRSSAETQAFDLIEDLKMQNDENSWVAHKVPESTQFEFENLDLEFEANEIKELSLLAEPNLSLPNQQEIPLRIRLVKATFAKLDGQTEELALDLGIRDNQDFSDDRLASEIFLLPAKK